jgi:hypothetical protein
MDVRAWLQQPGLERFADTFAANDIDAETLRSLTAEDLRELGVASLGHRKRLLDAVASLLEPAPATAKASAGAAPRAAKPEPAASWNCSLAEPTRLWPSMAARSTSTWATPP